MKIQLIRNATMKIENAGRTILADPMLARKDDFDPVVGIARNPTVELPFPVRDRVVVLLRQSAFRRQPAQRGGSRMGLRLRPVSLGIHSLGFLLSAGDRDRLSILRKEDEHPALQRKLQLVPER